MPFAARSCLVPFAASASLVPFAASSAFTKNGSWQWCWEGTNLGATASNCY